jgi:hypothetical protein
MASISSSTPDNQNEGDGTVQTLPNEEPTTGSPSHSPLSIPSANFRLELVDEGGNAATPVDGSKTISGLFIWPPVTTSDGHRRQRS